MTYFQPINFHDLETVMSKIHFLVYTTSFHHHMVSTKIKEKENETSKQTNMNKNKQKYKRKT